jgi:hypothetical protein
MQLSDSRIAFVANALRVAAEVYGTDARNLAHQDRTAQQFLKQQADALTLADLFDGADTVTVTP